MPSLVTYYEYQVKELIAARLGSKDWYSLIGATSALLEYRWINIVFRYHANHPKRQISSKYQEMATGVVLMYVL